jgi:hypothetical protein
MPVESFIAFLRDATNDMPAYSAGVLSDQDAADIHAYLRTLPGPQAGEGFPAVESMRRVGWLRAQRANRRILAIRSIPIVKIVTIGLRLHSPKQVKTLVRWGASSMT